MIKSGDVLEAKSSFLVRNSIPYEKRFFKVKQIGSYFLEVEDEEGNNYLGTELLREFYIPTNVNREILKLISDEDISIKEFNAVTVDGKVINFKATR